MTPHAVSPRKGALALFCAPAALAVLVTGLSLPAPAYAALSPSAEEIDQVVVTTTRTRRRVQDEPIRVEVLPREEIEEKAIMAPGNIAIMLAETGGLWVQANSAALGSAGVRVQGMSERYTLLLADGLPLYGGQAGSIGLLQIPPTDLGRVEVIKGASSSLYGGAALGGVINLISRRPGDDFEGEVLANITGERGQDLTAYAAAPLSHSWSASLTAGGHWQERRDLDGSGWADIPAYERYTLRPRLFWTGAGGGEALITLGHTRETRRGGTLPGATVPDGAPFMQGLDTERVDAGLNLDVPLSDALSFGVRASAMQTRHKLIFGPERERDRHRTGFAEASLTRTDGRHTLVGGLAVQVDDYVSDDFAVFDYRFTVPGVFAQYDVDVSEALTVSASVRADSHSEYGEFLSPRLSALWRAGPWSLRASAARGYVAPSPFIGSVEETGLSRLEPLSGLRAEEADTMSFDVGRRFGSLETNIVAFRSRVTHEAALIPTGNVQPDGTDIMRVINAPGANETYGAELLVRYRYDHFVVTGSYMHTRSTRTDPVTGLRGPTPQTPRHSAGFVAMWEDHDRGRLGFEAYYTGGQDVDDNPYRTRARPFVNMGILGEIVLGRFSVFLNAENILDIRQSRYDPLVRPSRAADGRWSVDAWAPTDGFVVNGGIRVRFGAAAHHGHHHDHEDRRHDH
ncbi:TonB-dependent receptor [Alkalicaulis satelles]|uniref:TonB-dependent receptor n=1 Tax=Alkalicaulis satelles TaxID=2609175 RepID=A0A5M6ZK53_9PROT|nr:TonB-dependent receptor [Alkalicaulis satelles]KAA5804720.1 TonB-dependent receptor [Alkalicaulis satelles]